MKKYLAELCALCLLFLGAALAETDIRLADAGVEAGAGVEVDGSSISIVKGGSYRLTGTMAEGHIAVEADGVELIWDGAQLACSTTAPLTARGDLRLTGLHLGFLQAEKIRVLLREIIGKALAQTGAKAVDIPRNQLHDCPPVWPRINFGG